MIGHYTTGLEWATTGSHPGERAPILVPHYNGCGDPPTGAALLATLLSQRSTATPTGRSFSG